MLASHMWKLGSHPRPRIFSCSPGIHTPVSKERGLAPGLRPSGVWPATPRHREEHPGWAKLWVRRHKKMVGERFSPEAPSSLDPDTIPCLCLSRPGLAGQTDQGFVEVSFCSHANNRCRGSATENRAWKEGSGQA